MKKRPMFFIFICLAGMLIGIGQWCMYKQGLAFFAIPWSIIPFLLLPIIFTLPNIIKNQFSVPISKFLSYLGGYWLIFFYYSLYLLLLYALAYIFTGIFQLRAYWPEFSAKLISAGFFVIIFLIVWGNWNAFHHVCRHITIRTTKPLTKNYTIAFISDIHLGAMLGKSFAQKLTQKINMEQPDIILFGGDIIDGNLDLVIREGSYRNLKNITAPLGKFAVYGNHDYFGGDLTKEQQLFSSVGVEFLQNQTTLIDNSVKITGLDDYLYNPTPVPPIKNETAAFFHILLEHEPYQITPAAAADYDLYLAGHTHAGQFYPDRLITKRIYVLDYGCKIFNKMTAIVSNGYGFWGTPIRLGPLPEIVLIHLQKK